MKKKENYSLLSIIEKEIMKIVYAFLPLMSMLHAVEQEENISSVSQPLNRTIAYGALLRKGETWTNPEKEFTYHAKVEMTNLYHPEIIVESITANGLDLNSEIKPLIKRNIALYIKQRSFAEKFTLQLPGENTSTVHQIDFTGTNNGWYSIFDEQVI